MPTKQKFTPQGLGVGAPGGGPIFQIAPRLGGGQRLNTPDLGGEFDEAFDEFQGTDPRTGAPVQRLDPLKQAQLALLRQKFAEERAEFPLTQREQMLKNMHEQYGIEAEQQMTPAQLALLHAQADKETALAGTEKAHADLYSAEAADYGPAHQKIQHMSEQVDALATLFGGADKIPPEMKNKLLAEHGFGGQEGTAVAVAGPKDELGAPGVAVAAAPESEGETYAKHLSQVFGRAFGGAAQGAVPTVAGATPAPVGAAPVAFQQPQQQKPKQKPPKKPKKFGLSFNDQRIPIDVRFDSGTPNQ